MINENFELYMGFMKKQVEALHAALKDNDFVTAASYAASIQSQASAIVAWTEPMMILKGTVTPGGIEAVMSEFKMMCDLRSEEIKSLPIIESGD